MKHVAVIGASCNENRYSHKAQKKLMDHGHTVFPISPDGKKVLGILGYTSTMEVPGPLDVVTIYVRPSHLPPIIKDLLEKKPALVIFNPGTESEENESILTKHGISVTRACTLVLLATGQFESL